VEKLFGTWQKSVQISLRDLGHEARENVSALCNELWSALFSNRRKVRLHVLLQSVGRLVRLIVSRQSGELKFSLFEDNLGVSMRKLVRCLTVHLDVSFSLLQMKNARASVHEVGCSPTLRRS
jgi:hypothetical protein